MLGCRLKCSKDNDGKQIALQPQNFLKRLVRALVATSRQMAIERYEQKHGVRVKEEDVVVLKAWWEEL
jgi:hypothetical protein